MSPAKSEELKQRAFKVREHILRMSTNGGCFTGASLSCTDLIVYLYSGFLNISKETLSSPERDFLLLSKGHDVPALYGTFVELGWLEKSRLQNHLKTNDDIYWHPNRNIPGIEFHSGSLGHLPSVGLGIAMDNKIRGLKNRVIVITGDGELDEGSVWETLHVASAYKMNHLTLVVDRNHFQANMKTEELIPLEPLEDKFRAFGCAVKHVNGHDFEQLEAVFSSLPFSSEKPSVIIADTVRGKGVRSIEARADRWFCNFSAQEVDDLLKEFHGGTEVVLTSDVIIAR